MARGFWRKLSEPERRVLYHWRCECGAHSRGGNTSKYDTERRAERHQLEAGVDMESFLAGKRHPLPNVYETEDAVD